MPKQPAIPGLRNAMRTRREKFFAEMEAVVPWTRFLALIEPHYPKAGPKGGRPPMPLETMWRVYCLQQWYALSDPMAEEMLYDSSGRISPSSVSSWRRASTTSIGCSRPRRRSRTRRGRPSISWLTS